MKNVHIDDVSVGDTYTLDDGFTCRHAGRVEIKSNENGQLYFECNEGRHYLNGQISDSGILIGIYVD
jgi:hypothetical protein